MLNEDCQLFIGLTETWLKDHKDAELNIEGYQLFRSDRKRSKRGRRGRLSGGVAAYVREDIASKMELSLAFSNGVVEILGLNCPSENLFLAIIYRQPNDTIGGHSSTSTELKAALNKLSDALSKLPTPAPNIIIGRDFNIPHINWADSTHSIGASSDEKEIFELLKKLQNENFLKQHIHQATHNAGNVLDLVFTNNDYLMHSYQCRKLLPSISDHHLVECLTAFKSTTSNHNEQKPEFISPLDKLNFFSDEIKWDVVSAEITAIEWDAELQNQLPDQMLDKIMMIIISICERHIPIKKSVQKSSMSKIPRDRRNLMRKRKRLNDKLKSDTSSIRRSNIEAKLTNIEIQLQQSYKNTLLQNEKRAIDAIKSNPKYFFSYAKKFSKLATKIGPLLNSNNEYTSSSAEMSEILREQYESVFSEQMSSSIYAELARDSPEQLINISFSETEIIAAIDELTNNSSSGPDGIPAILLKNCKSEICTPIYQLWRKSLDMGIAPSSLKLSHIIPCHKGDHRGIPANYRPIALTSHIIKLFEKVMRNKIVAYLDEGNLFNKSQHGFRQGRSCLSQLLAHHDEVLANLEKGLNVDTIYLDFSKAFDKVDHQIVLAKLSILGIGGNLLKWIQSFLLNRMQHVLVNGFLSTPSHVKSGVPQGSVIGPLLFLILIGDIDADLHNSSLRSFADDTRASKGIASLRDVSLLQYDLEIIYKWAIENNMLFNSKKLELIRYGSNHHLKEQTHYLAPDGSIIPEKTHIRDLGVIMSNSGTFSEHINTTCEKARNMCSWILRTFRSRSPVLMKTLWKSLVLPILDYCSQLWSPCRQGQIQQIETIQQSFTRKIALNNVSSNYWDRLSHLKLYSLQRRRERYMIMYVWKILEGHVPNISGEGYGGILKLHNETDRNGRSCRIPALRNCPANIRQLREGSLKYHGSQLFNALPKDIRNISNCSIDCFKRKLDSFLLKVDDMPLVRGYTSGRRTESNSLTHVIPYYLASVSRDTPPTTRRSPDLRRT